MKSHLWKAKCLLEDNVRAPMERSDLDKIVMSEIGNRQFRHLELGHNFIKNINNTGLQANF